MRLYIYLFTIYIYIFNNRNFRKDFEENMSTECPVLIIAREDRMTNCRSSHKLTSYHH